MVSHKISLEIIVHLFLVILIFYLFSFGINGMGIYSKEMYLITLNINKMVIYN